MLQQIQQKVNTLIARHNTILLSLFPLVCGIYFASLPFFAGKIISDQASWIHGFSVNYLHLRITARLLFDIVVPVYLLWWAKRATLPIPRMLILAVSFMACGTFTLQLISCHILAQSLNVSVVPFLLENALTFGEWVLTSIVVLVCIFYYSTRSKDRPTILTFIAGSLAIQTLIALAQQWYGKPILPFLLTKLGQPPVFESFTYVGLDSFTRAYGTTPHPNILAGIAGFFLVLTFITFQTSSEKWLAWFIRLCAVAILLMTLSKGALLGGVGAWVGFIITNQLVNKTKKKEIDRNTFLRMVCIVSIILITLGILVNVAITHYIGPLPYFLETRGKILRAYAEIVWQHPLLLITGTGMLGAIPTLIGNLSTLKTSLIQQGTLLLEPIHNSFLLAALELGLPLTITWAILYAKLVKNLLPSTLSKETVTLIMALVIYAILIGTWDHYLWY